MDPMVVSRVTKWGPGISQCYSWYDHLRQKGVSCCIAKRGVNVAVFRELRLKDLYWPDDRGLSDLRHFEMNKKDEYTEVLRAYRFNWGH